MGLIGREVGSLPGCDFDWFGWGIGGLVPEQGGGAGGQVKGVRLERSLATVFVVYFCICPNLILLFFRDS